jgi:tyrosinase
MWPFKKSSHHYEAVSSDDIEPKEQKEPHQNVLSKRTIILLFIIVVLVVVSALAFSVVYLILNDSTTSQGTVELEDNDPRCPLRREWRTLRKSEQQGYISAVLCLRNQSSILAPTKQTIYEDFPWIHSRVGYFTHNSAPFLPWHRYFLHIYENTLREKCDYQGSLVYWDWTLDSDAIENSPVFDPDTGFGGDGEVGGELTVSNTGRCVVDGPFAGIVVPYYDVKYQPHCLSRGFRDLEGNLGHINGSDITPESIEEVLSIDGYEQFVALMESRVHDAIPYGISGDFETFTAPYGTVSHVYLAFFKLTMIQILYSFSTTPNWTACGGCGSSASPERASLLMAATRDGIRLRWLALTTGSSTAG